MLQRSTEKFTAELDVDTDLALRPARRDDMSAIADFVRSSAEWYREFVSEDDMAEHDVDEEWEERNYRMRHFFIGSHEDQDVGTISLQFFGDCAYLGYIYLDVEHVGNGFGRDLISYAEAIARKRDMQKLVLIAHPEATWAKRAYLKYGFEIIESDPERVKAWRDGMLEEYYEDGFELYVYELEVAEDADESKSREVSHAR